MLVIRLFRTGKRNQPSFKIVVTDKRNPPRGGRFVEEVGFYNPLTKEKVLRKERVQHWMQKGAKPSPTVFNLLVKEGILEGKKILLHKKPKKEQKPEEAPKPVSAPAEAPKAEEKQKEAAPEGGEPRPETSGPEKPKEEKKEEKIAEKPAEKK